MTFLGEMMMPTRMAITPESLNARASRLHGPNPTAAPHALADRRKASLQKSSDEAVMEALVEGDKHAIQVLFARHNVRVFRYVVRLVRNPSVAEDLVNEVFLEVWRQPGKFSGRSRVATWLLAIARNKALTVLRRCSDVELDDETAMTIEDPSDDPEATVEKSDRSEILRKCLTQLSPMHREVIDLVYYHEKSVGEVAQIIAAPQSTVKTRMFYARNQIERLLEQAGIDRACL
jgi:RNA polymerase sigma-70 factor (ECF subfamily)